MSSPTFLPTLLSTPHPCITPGPIQANKGYDPSLASEIADALYHPAVEVALHLLNGDLYSAHFLARKMQNDQYGQWLHGILHRYEGDLTNAKAWYTGLPQDLLSLCPLYSSSSHLRSNATESAQYQALLLIDQVGIVGRGFGAEKLRKQYGDKAIGFPESAPTQEEIQAELDRLKPKGGGDATYEEGKKEINQKCHDELKWLLEKLVEMYGWEKGVEGTKGYTESTEKQKEISRRMVGGGEGIRKF